ncbi:hypothetical protein Tsubulata_026746 [Turnera subulata]|uniref:F-box domain-containing protein n=1 Tax=Turnera subulata TaxID=218843 RepID=A0A9Q0F2M2_9ROSI|nr:hypothetical protein Tsubulata_026746 [Turnera subulata]
MGKSMKKQELVPDDLIVEILSRLPTKSLDRFRGVSILNGNPHWLSNDDLSKHDDEDWVLYCGSSRRFLKERSLMLRFDLEGETLIQVPQSRGKYFCDTASLAAFRANFVPFVLVILSFLYVGNEGVHQLLYLS